MMPNRSVAVLLLRLAAFSCVLVALAGFLAVSPPSTSSPSGAGPAPTEPHSADVGLGVWFEPNLGQATPETAYLGFAGDSMWSFGAGWAAASLPAPQGQPSELRLEFPGSIQVSPQGAHPATGITNYVQGSDPDSWVTGVSHWRQVRYPSLYPGIDLVFRGSGAAMEYDFVVAPGGDPGNIRVRLVGAQEVRLAPEGDVVAVVGGSEVRHARPVAYQETPLGRNPVAVRFRLEGPVASFEVGAHDPGLPLVIDPLVLAYSTYVGGSVMDLWSDVAVSPKGDVFLAGTTASPGLPVTVGLPFQGIADAFVARITPMGGGAADIVYLTYLGGTSTDVGYSIAVDHQDYAYVTGYTDSTDFPTAGATQPALGGGIDAFLTLFTPAGMPLFSTFHGGSATDIGWDLDVVGAFPNPRVVVAGMTASLDHPTTPGAFQPTFGGGGTDAFVARWSGSGPALTLSSFLGGASNDAALGVAIGGNPVSTFVTGATSSAGTFPVLAGAFQATYGGGASDAFLVRMPGVGAAPDYASYLGGLDPDGGMDVAWVPSLDDVFVVGSTVSLNFPVTLGAFQPSLSVGSADAFLARISPDGAGSADNQCTTYLGGLNADRGSDVASDAAGNAYLTGLTASPNFPVSPGASQPLHGGDADAFVTSLSMACDGPLDLRYSTFLGGPQQDQGLGTALDPMGRQVVAGGAFAFFPTTPGAPQTASAGIEDGFLSILHCPAAPC